MRKLVLGNKNYSSWSMRPWLTLKKARIDFEEIVVPLYEDRYKRDLARYSPSSKVPILITNNIKIWDSLAICEYAAEIESSLWPENKHTRALARSISYEMHSGFESIRSSMPMNCRGQDRRIKITDQINSELDCIESIWTDSLENHISNGSWLFGDFTIADAMYAPIVSRFNTYGVVLNTRCSEYMQHVLNDEFVKQWFETAQLEPYVIESSEIGIN